MEDKEDITIYDEYDKYLSPLAVWAIAFGCTIGWGAFFMPGSTFLPVAGPLGTLISICISVVIMLIIGTNFSYLMRNRPGTGGVYAYTKEAFDRDHAFLCAWFLALSYLTILFMNATSLFLVIKLVFGTRLQIGYNYYNIAGNHIFLGEVGASIVALAIVGLLFINAKPLLQHLQTILAVLLLVSVVIIGVVCLRRLSPETLQGAFGIQGSSPAFGIFSIAMLAPWAFAGFEVISLETAHFKFKVSRSRWVIIAAIVLSGLVYIFLTLASVSSVPDGYTSWQTYIADLDNLDGIESVPTFFAASAAMGSGGVKLIMVAAMAAILTGMIAAYRATMRMLSTMAEDLILSEKFANTNNSILFIMVVSMLVSIFGRNLLSCFRELTSFGAIIGFGYTSASAWKLARKNGSRSAAVTGCLGTLLSAAFALVQLVPKLTAVETIGSNAFLLLMIWCLLGFLFYLRTVARSHTATGSGISAAGVVLFALLLYSALMWLGQRLMAAENLEQVHSTIRLEGSLMLVIIFISLGVMMYIHTLTRRKLQSGERDEESTETAAQSIVMKEAADTQSEEEKP